MSKTASKENRSRHGSYRRALQRDFGPGYH